MLSHDALIFYQICAQIKNHGICVNAGRSSEATTRRGFFSSMRTQIAHCSMYPTGTEVLNVILLIFHSIPSGRRRWDKASPAVFSSVSAAIPADSPLLSPTLTLPIVFAHCIASFIMQQTLAPERERKKELKKHGKAFKCVSFHQRWRWKGAKFDPSASSAPPNGAHKSRRRNLKK